VTLIAGTRDFCRCLLCDAVARLYIARLTSHRSFTNNDNYNSISFRNILFPPAFLVSLYQLLWRTAHFVYCE